MKDHERVAQSRELLRQLGEFEMEFTDGEVKACFGSLETVLGMRSCYGVPDPVDSGSPAETQNLAKEVLKGYTICAHYRERFKNLALLTDCLVAAVHDIVLKEWEVIAE